MKPGFEPPPGRIVLKLERWHRRSIYATGMLLLLSGAGWLLFHFFLRPVSAFGDAVSPVEPWAMKLHGAAAMASLFFVGSLLHLHIRRALRAGRNTLTGWAMVATLALLTVTGYGLYYVAGEADRPLWSLLHWAAGLLVAALLVLHIQVGRRSMQGSR